MYSFKKVCVLHVLWLDCHYALLVCRLKDAWSLALALDSPDSWNELAEAALEHIDIPIGKTMTIFIIFFC